MTFAYVGVLWIHVFCMTFWMGSAVFGTILGGQPRVQTALEQNDFTRTLVPRLYTAYPIAVLLGVVSGIMLGSVFGPVRSLQALFGTAYGITMSIAFVLVVVANVLGPATPPAWKPQWVTRLRLGELCILGAFTCMMFMRAGL